MCCFTMCDSRQYGWSRGEGGCWGGGGEREKEGRSSVKESLCKIKVSFSLNFSSSLLFECAVLLNMCEQTIRGKRRRSKKKR